MVTIVFGIFEFGIAYNNYIALTHAAREGARLAAVGKDIAYITDHVTTIAPSVQIASITIDPSDPSSMIVGQPVTVTVTGEVLQIDIPFAYSGAITLSSTAEMRVETNNPE
ncbi:MAG: TadE family protein [Candidatus Humimicrobiaceae bacterium]